MAAQCSRRPIGTDAEQQHAGGPCGATSWTNASSTRLGEVLTEDAERSGSAFGFAPVVALEATGSVLSAEGHASARLTR
jgi:hypothetical protein